MNHPFSSLSKPLVGMLHTPALPGTPKSTRSINEIIDHVSTEASVLAEAGFHALMIENMHDVPYIKPPADPAIIAAMTVIAAKVREETTLPLGIQMLCGANQEALAVAKASGADFIRAEGFVYGHVGDEGYLDSCAGHLLRYRKQIDAEHIAVLTDIKKKHAAHALTQDVSISETAHAAEFFLSDGLIVTGASTGKEAELSDLENACSGSQLPVYVGSGITADNLHRYFELATGFIIGSSIKQKGDWSKPLDKERIQRITEVYRSLL